MENLQTKPGAIRVGIVDDHITVAAGVTKLLNDMKDILCTLEVYNGEELLSELRDTVELPDIILMDIDMPGMGGVQATRKVSELYPLIKIIAFTRILDEQTVRQMIAAGACGYVLKQVQTTYLEETINKVYSHEKYHANLLHVYGEGFGKMKIESARIIFKPHEIRFLELLCAGLTYRQMSLEMKVGVSTIRYYKTCVGEKLETQNLIVIVIEALRLGLVK